MQTTKSALYTALAGVMLLATDVQPAHAGSDGQQSMEKCAGVVKKGKNDCSSLNGSHGCASMAPTDNDPNEWIYLPQGACEKIGGTVVKPTNSESNADQHSS